MGLKTTISFEIEIFETLQDLENSDRELLEAAVKARHNAYAPYSRFNVGAAVLLNNKKIILGNNQENASYPSGLCAERVAVFHACATYPDARIEKVAVSASSSLQVVNKPAAPCGNCRQSLLEYERRQNWPIILLLRGAQGRILKCNSISDLLPLGFDNSYLG